MIEKILADIAIFLASAFKFSYIMFVIIMSNGRWDVIMSNILGGIAGIFLFTFLEAFLESLYLKYFPRRKFSKTSRFLAFIKDKFGVWGIAAISPIISFPVAILLALTITTNKWEVVGKMIFSLTTWSSIIYLVHFAIRFF